MTTPIDAGRRWGKASVAVAVLLLAGLLIAAASVLDLFRVRTIEATQAIPAITGLSATPVTTGSPARVDYARLDRRIATLMQEPDMVGLAVGTVEDGQVRFVRGYGEVLAGTAEPVTPDTVFRWGSVSKGLAASLVVKLAADGGPALETPVADLGTSLRLPPGSEGVSVADVLSHRVGLSRNAWDDRLEDGEDPRVLRSGLASLPRECLPSTCHSYQNIAFDTATEVVEGAAGASYAATARARLFTPLGMTSASVDRAGLERARSWARPHRLARRPTTVNDVYYRIPAAGGVNSSISDLVRWMRAQLGAAPAVLSPAMLATLHAPRVPTAPRGRRSAMDRAMTGAAYGLGWRSFTYAGHHLVGHRGTVDGYGSLILFDPAGKSGIVMMWNSNWHRAARLQLEFFDMLYGLPTTDWLELKPRTIDAAAPIRPAPLISLPPAGPAPRATSSPPRS